VGARDVHPRRAARSEAGRGPAERPARAVPPWLRERGRKEPRGGEGAVEHAADPAAAEAQAPAGRAESDEERLVRGGIGAQHKPRAQQRDDAARRWTRRSRRLPRSSSSPASRVEVREVGAVALDRAQPLPREERDESPVAGRERGRAGDRADEPLGLREGQGALGGRPRLAAIGRRPDPLGRVGGEGPSLRTRHETEFKAR
jgi:hypothetical protein